MPNLQKIVVNGKPHSVSADADESLLRILRDHLDMTGTKYGCGEAQCAACTVLIDGEPTPSCITPVGSVAGKQITTIEGLEINGQLHPVQQAFLDEDAFQCGYCTSGMIMGAVALLRTNPHPTDEEIMTAMERHICRCGTYRRILRAIRKASQTTKAAHTPPTPKTPGRIAQ